MLAVERHDPGIGRRPPLNLAQELLTLGELQPQVGKIAEITRDPQHVNAAR
jgi:hypothetical protein